MSSRAKKPRKAPATKPILAGCVVAIAGSDLGRGDWSEANVARWVAAWGGTFSADVDGATTTHLLATANQYNDPKNTRVGRAKKLLFPKKGKGKDKAGSSRLQHIVTPDWLEDSLHGKKRLPEKRYSLREAQRLENAQKKREERVAKGIEKGKRLVNDCINHIYSDSTYFFYKIELTRNDEERGNVGQKYQICIWESKAKPHHYQMTAKYYRKPGDSHPLIDRFPKETPTLFDPVFAHFKYFFRKKTKIDWDDRLAKAGSKPKKYWQYKPPTGGKPAGLVRGEPPSIFGDGTNIVLHRDEDSGGDGGGGSNGKDKPAIVNPHPQTTATAGKTMTRRNTTGHNNTTAAEIVSESHGDDDVVMMDASAQQDDDADPPFSGNGGDRADENSSLAARVMMLAGADQDK